MPYLCCYFQWNILHQFKFTPSMKLFLIAVFRQHHTGCVYGQNYLKCWKRPWCWERLKAGGEGANRRWDGWMASLTRWTRVWVAPGIGDGQGSLGCCSPWGHRVRHNWETKLNWTDLNYICITCQAPIGPMFNFHNITTDTHFQTDYNAEYNWGTSKCSTHITTEEKLIFIFVQIIFILSSCAFLSLVITTFWGTPYLKESQNSFFWTSIVK